MANPAAELGALFAQALGSGLVVDLIMLLVLAEALLLWWLRRRFRRGPGLGPVWPTLVSGVLLLDERPSSPCRGRRHRAGRPRCAVHPSRSPAGSRYSSSRDRASAPGPA